MAQKLEKPELWIVNGKTGEIIADKVIFFGKKPWMTDRNFVKVWVGALQDIVMDPDLSSTGALRLLFYMISRMEYHTLRISCTVEEACDMLEIHRNSYYAWIKLLIEKGLVERLAANIYRLRPLVAVRGSMARAAGISPRVAGQAKVKK